MDKFSRLCSALSNLRRKHQEQWEDLDRYYAPGECYSAVGLAQEREEVALLASYGMTPSSFHQELVARTTPRYAHYFASNYC